MAGAAAGLLEARCRVHRVAEQRYLALESADFAGHERPRMKTCAKLGKVPMPAQEIGARHRQGIPTREQTADRARVVLGCAKRPGRNQCVADVAMHLATKVG